jgi:hypothetical protein
LFSAAASGEAFEGGYSDSGEQSHDANNGEEFDEGEGRRGAALGKNWVHNEDQYTKDLHCQHWLTK